MPVFAPLVSGFVLACLAAGMDDCLAKPIHPGELLALLKRHLPAEVPVKVR